MMIWYLVTTVLSFLVFMFSHVVDEGRDLTVLGLLGMIVGACIPIVAPLAVVLLMLEPLAKRALKTAKKTVLIKGR